MSGIIVKWTNEGLFYSVWHPWKCKILHRRTSGEGCRQYYIILVQVYVSDLNFIVFLYGENTWNSLCVVFTAVFCFIISRINANISKTIWVAIIYDDFIIIPIFNCTFIAMINNAFMTFNFLSIRDLVR